MRLPEQACVADPTKATESVGWRSLRPYGWVGELGACWSRGDLTTLRDKTSRLFLDAPAHPIMLSHQECHVAADQVTIEAPFIDIDRDAALKVNAMPDPTACR